MYIGRDKQKAALSLTLRKSRESAFKNSLSDLSELTDAYELNSSALSPSEASPEVQENEFTITDQLQQLSISYDCLLLFFLSDIFRNKHKNGNPISHSCFGCIEFSCQKSV